MLYVLLGLAAAAIIVWLVRRRRIEARRRALAARPLTPEWRAWLEDHVPLYARLPRELRPRLDGAVNVFLDEKRFYGQHGLEVTDEMRLTVAAQACLLTLNLPEKHYPGFTSIILYPDTFITEQTRHDGWIEIVGDEARIGESWDRGPVILSWADTAEDTRNPDDGCNVVLHEFAHKLDEHDGGMDGAPALAPAQMESWRRVFTQAYEALADLPPGAPEPVLDPYGATSPAEFFAVATETFFECAPALREEHPALYAELRQFYGLDPATW